MGNIIATGVQSNVTAGRDQELLVIPVVTQEQYYIEVFSSVGQTNAYELEIENFAAPIPDAVVLDPADDTGASNSDHVTSDQLARIFIEADLADFAAEGIDILDPTEVANQEPGAAVQVFVNGVAVGYATPVLGTGDTLFQYTFAAGQLSTTFIPTGGGALNFVKGAVRIFDGQRNAVGNPAPANGRTLLSEPLLLTLDMQIANPAAAPDLLATSDSGMFNNDNVTNIQEAGVPGHGRSQLASPRVGQRRPRRPGRGEHQRDVGSHGRTAGGRVYDITYVLEDAAGNISAHRRRCGSRSIPMHPTRPCWTWWRPAIRAAITTTT